MLPRILTFVDLETTGMSLSYDRVIEIGIVRVEDGKEVSRYTSLLNPDIPLAPEIEFLTGISQEMLINAPTFWEVSDAVSELLSEAVFVAHNVRFDYGFLKREYKRLGESFTMKHFCTAKLSRQLFARHRHHNLDSIITRCNLSCNRRHRALDDAAVLWDFLQHLRRTIPKEQFEEALRCVMKKPSYPAGLSEKMIDQLPQTSGVYVFYGNKRMPLYVGKSINIHERVRSHFSSDHSSSRELKLSQQVIHIETYTTGGELGAFLEEAQLVKKLQPLYNRALRYARKLLVLKKQKNKNGYTTVVAQETAIILPNELGDIICISKSKKQATEFLAALAEEKQLCEKLLGIDNSRGSCFNFRLGKCKGACIGKEKPLLYNLRCDMVFASCAVKPWPFEGPIVIKEENTDVEKTDYFLFDKWCFLGQATTMDAFENVSFQSVTFDYDVYSILLRYIRSPKNWKHITSVSQQVVQAMQFSHLSRD